jgi:hypothetical protein
MRALLVALLVGMMLSAGCGSGPKPVAPGAMEYLTKQSGLTLPGTAKVVFEETEARAAAEGYGMWIVSAGEEPKLPGEGLAVPQDAVRKVLETQLRSSDLGANAPGDGKSYRWTSGNSDWRASVLQTTTGWHMVIERSKK